MSEKALNETRAWKARVDAEVTELQTKLTAARIEAAELREQLGGTGMMLAMLQEDLDAARADAERLRKVLVWLDIQGGLGHGKHAAIAAAISTPDAGAGTQPGERDRYTKLRNLIDRWSKEDEADPEGAARRWEAVKGIGTRSPVPAAGAGLMLPDLWTVVDGGGTRVCRLHETDLAAARRIQEIVGTPGSVHGPYRVVMIPQHMAAVSAPRPAGGGE